MTIQASVGLFVVAMLAGAVNSVAGGGTLLTFPALLAVLHHNGPVANATSTVALWPGQLSSLFGYRKEIGQSRRTIALMALPSLIGGGIGAVLLVHTPPSTFAVIVPYLILLATVLFMLQERISRLLKGKAPNPPTPFPTGEGAAMADAVIASNAPASSPAGEGADALSQTSAGSMVNDRSGETAEIDQDKETDTISPSPRGRGRGLGQTVADDEPPHHAARAMQVMLFQLAVAVYGGYFGAGIGILMLAALGFLGFTNIHKMNGIKNINGLCINAVAITLFAFDHTAPGNGVGPHHNSLIDWPIAALMTVGSIVGGYSGAGAARKIGQRNVRTIIIVIGFALTLSLLIKR